jgi:hypothetical protein
VLTITTAAAKVVRRWVEGSSLRLPVVHLTVARETPREINAAIDRGATQQEVQRLARDPTILESWVWRLYPVVWPASRNLWMYSTTREGFRFAPRFRYPPRVRRALKTGVLDVAENGGLVLKDASGTIVLPEPIERAL